MSYTTEDFLSVRCLYCGALPGELCVKRTGQHFGEPLLPFEGHPTFHSARVRRLKAERHQFSPPDDITDPVEWVPLRQLLREGRFDEVISKMALALPDLGISYAIRLVDGEQAADRYLKASGRVRVNADGEQCVPVPREEGTP